MIDHSCPPSIWSVGEGCGNAVRSGRGTLDHDSYPYQNGPSRLGAFDEAAGT